MDTSFYDAILRDAIWRHATIFLVVGALLVIGLILNIVFYRGTLKRLAHRTAGGNDCVSMLHCDGLFPRGQDVQRPIAA